MTDNSLSSLLVLYCYVCGLPFMPLQFSCSNDRRIKVALGSVSLMNFAFFFLAEKKPVLSASVPVY